MPLNPSHTSWCLRTPGSCYVVAVEVDAQTGEATVLQKYWGPPLATDAARQVVGLTRGPSTPDGAGRHVTSFAEPVEIEELLPVTGGRRWGPAALEVSFGAVRSVELEFLSAKADDERLDLSLADRHFPLEVVLSFQIRPDGDVIERWVTIRNTALPDSDLSDITVTRFHSGSWFLPDADDYRYTGVVGAWAEEFQLRRGPLPVGELTYTSRQGITGHQSNPWIMIDAGTATETEGAVFGLALAWSGSWRLTATRRPEGGVAVAAGFGHEGLRWPLPAGAELVSPRMLGLYCEGGFGAASRAWHDYTRAFVLPASDEVRPVLYNSWEATGFTATAQGQLSLARTAAALGAELFVVDDGWFARRDDATSSLGDWWPHPERFPDGLGVLFEEIRALGMRVGLWVEPESVSPDSELYRAHPDWVLRMDHRRHDTKRDQLVLNFARPEVRDWALDWLSRLVAELGIDYLKWDVNRPFTQPGWPERSADQDLLWIDHTRNVYRVMDILRARRPALRIETCSGGGGRVDLGVLHHVDQAWPSDNTDAKDRQTAQHGFSQLYPAAVMGAWVTDSPNPNTQRDMPLRYRFHVAMAGVLGIGADIGRWTPEELTEARSLIDAYKQIRRTVQHGRQYRLGGIPGAERSAVQYILGDEVAVLVYNPLGNAKSGPRRLKLAGLDPDATYEVVAGGSATSVHGRLSHRSRWYGSVLMSAGVRPAAWEPIGADYRSDLVVLHRIPTP
ncbi:alpha-galactosidase [Micromonospora sp. KC723]|uniref:alpha-galactosidase n=1 Tax=Micromonospora sp. KC723 TaxID=2530381 RepID=UPI0014044DCA|nr:alpha-galactosidase [Micromonospora sp. KC723]